MKIAILGTGAYGLALAYTMHNNNHDITMWTKFEEECNQLNKTRKNEKLLPGFQIPKEIKFSCNMQEVVKDAQLIVIAVPAPFVDNIALELKNYIKESQHIIIASKGIENDTCLFLNDVVENQIQTDKIGVISGPSFAIDIITKMPIGLTIASTNEETINITKKALANEYFKLRETHDIIGTEVCGAIKNVIAIASGMLSGMNANESTKAMFITESLHDIKEIIDVLGGDKKTILSFAGFGDLLLTCTTPKSRNFSFGYTLVTKKEEEIEEYKNTHTIEGLYTLTSIHQLLNNKGANIPMIELIYDIVFHKQEPKELLSFLITKS
jgi:glycerol-3-phosphate dehydrogenase (NAD(P)+)